ncbi:hypothetical protein FHS83_003499 [Rhizomicrobium palustre]|uniref:Lipoprotein n=2 Tax=Rhizomicrobium palustre TaxID=189966 RepID=A0A846N4R7_9PROT|nr:hypothetical protein [Rhizomicrobium palustre]
MKNLIVFIAAVLLTISRAGAADTPEEAALRERLTTFYTSKPGFRLPSYAPKLDAAFDHSDWRTLKGELDKIYSSMKGVDDLGLIMNWELLRLANGGGYVVAKLYAVDSWNMALSFERAGRPGADDMKKRAFSNTLYTIALIAVDSPMCKDMSAPSNRMAEYRFAARDAIRFGQSLREDDKKRVIDFALRQEKLFAPLRKKDDALCRGGNDEAMAAMNAVKDFEKAKEVPADPSRPGRNYLIEAPGEYHPQYKPDAEWKKTRDEVRPTLRGQLETLLIAPK